SLLGLWRQELVLGSPEGPQLLLELRRLRQLIWREDIADLLCQGEVLLHELVTLARQLLYSGLQGIGIDGVRAHKQICQLLLARPHLAVQGPGILALCA